MRAAGSSGAGSFRNGLSSLNGGDAICFISSSICAIWSRDKGSQRSRERSSAPPSLRFSLQTLFTSIHSSKLIIRRNEKAANIDWIGWKQQQGRVLIGCICSTNNLLQGHRSVYLRFISAANWNERDEIRIRFHSYVCTIQKRQRPKF